MLNIKKDMRERKFLKELNNKNNEDGSFTYTIVSNLVESSDNKPVPSNIFNKIITNVCNKFNCTLRDK